MDTTLTLKYCLYARKSSEQDERQAMSIDSQIKEMGQIAVRDGVTVLDIRQESHSAKESGQRPELMKLIQDIRDGLFNAILTWAPDRLSRNAGDLGMLVDLMDQGKLLQIKTYSQNFSNNPNEKFLLMILCSQAKLENDQKGQNVKRGIRAKCEMGWRPGPPPIGYYNRTMAGLKDIIEDPDRGYVIKEMFDRARHGQSGRTIRRWFEEIGFTTRKGAQVALSQIYLMLKNPFYYGEFEYPVGGGKFYKGSHTPLVSRAIFDEVQKQLIVPIKSKWGGKEFDFKGLFKCACCSASIVGEDRYRKLKNGALPRYHIYYHCSRGVKYDCPEPYLTQDDLIKSLLRYINFMEMAHPHFLKITPRISQGMQDYREIRDRVLLLQEINPDDKPISLIEYANHVLKNGTMQQKHDVVATLNRQLYIHDKVICSSLIA